MLRRNNVYTAKHLAAYAVVEPGEVAINAVTGKVVPFRTSLYDVKSDAVAYAAHNWIYDVARASFNRNSLTFESEVLDYCYEHEDMLMGENTYLHVRNRDENILDLGIIKSVPGTTGGGGLSGGPQPELAIVDYGDEEKEKEIEPFRLDANGNSNMDRDLTEPLIDVRPIRIADDDEPEKDDYVFVC